jgi:hypothetical protein
LPPDIKDVDGRDEPGHDGEKIKVTNAG